MCSVSDSALDPRLVTSKLRLTPTTQCKKCPSTEVTVRHYCYLSRTD